MTLAPSSGRGNRLRTKDIDAGVHVGLALEATAVILNVWLIQLLFWSMALRVVPLPMIVPLSYHRTWAVVSSPNTTDKSRLLPEQAMLGLVVPAANVIVGHAAVLGSKLLSCDTSFCG